MKMFYFVDGPKPGFTDEFFRRLNQIGEPSPTWKIYPHAVRDGKALHLVEAESELEILDHLRHFGDIYERSEIIEIVSKG